MCGFDPLHRYSSLKIQDAPAPLFDEAVFRF